MSLINEIHGFHKNELSDYISGHADNLAAETYSKFCEEAKNLQQEILTEFDRQKDSFIQICYDIKAGKHKSWQPIYLDNNCSFYD